MSAEQPSKPATTGRPDTSIIIPTYRRPALLERVLRDLASAPLPAELREVLIVENGRRDGTEAICEQYADQLPVHFHFVDEPGKSNALNVALHLTDAEYIVFYDDDVRIDPAGPDAFIDGAHRYGPGHFFGGPVRPEYAGEPPADWMRPWFTTCVIGWSLGDEEQPHDEFLGANWAAFRSDLLGAGGFVRGLGPNAEFRTVGQEVEMQERLLARGVRGVYLPDASVQHYVPEHQCTLGWLRKRWYQQRMSRVLLSPEHLDAPRLADVPRFLWRQLLGDGARTLAARMIAPRTKSRILSEMKLAATLGQVAGYRRVRREGGFDAPAGMVPEAKDPE